jgi:hypothetical protein
MRPKLTFANLISCLALFVALGGLAVAAGLPKNSVGTKQLKKNSVTAIKIKDGAVSATKIRDGAVSGAKITDHSLTGTQIADGSLTGVQVKASTLGTVPTAERANSAERADSLPPPEPWHIVGAAGEPAFVNEWKNFEPTSSLDVVAFYKDHEGIVHLKGRGQGGTATRMFNLPPGFRPPEGKTIFPVVACECPADSFGVLNINGNSPSAPINSGAVYVPINATNISFDGVTFRAES